MKRRLTVQALLTAAALAPFAVSAQSTDATLRIVVGYAPGGSSDRVARIVAEKLQTRLGTPVIVENRPGAGGFISLEALSQAPPDGYTIGIITVEIGMMHHQGLTDLSGASYTPIALVNADPSGVQVRADAPYKNINDLVAAIKANPGKFKASGTGQGGIWHLAIAGFLRDQKVDPAALPWVPSNGAAPGLNDLVAGGVEVVPCSLPEARALIEAGKVKSLAVMDPNPAVLFPKVPTLKAAIGSNWTMAAWRGIAAPKGLPADIQAKLLASLKKAHDSKEFKEFMTNRGFGVLWAPAGEFASFMAKSDADLGATMKAVGIAK